MLVSKSGINNGLKTSFGRNKIVAYDETSVFALISIMRMYVIDSLLSAY